MNRNGFWKWFFGADTPRCVKRCPGTLAFFSGIGLYSLGIVGGILLSPGLYVFLPVGVVVLAYGIWKDMVVS